MQWQPEAVADWAFWLLVVCSYFTSALTAALGIGGGVTLLAIMANLLPALSVVPVHTVVQFGSNFGRLLTLRGFADWRILLWFSLGGVVGALAGGQLVISVPAAVIQTAMGVFILYSAWLPIFKLSSGRSSMALLGGVTSFLGMFISGTGPFVYVVLKDLFSDRRGVMATVAAINVSQQAVRAIIFALLGFAFAQWWLLIALMIATGFLGTLTGKVFLERVPLHIAQRLLKLVLTLLALRLLYVGISQFF
ncbi:sulfite exporter TauE/SafE family protein [Natronospirillum operosum]|uniref:Probable membrane transporter protein n=1 Tax=Natronospirillum operosum TaxID=2759953 RepID=A0A4Z0WEX7_9GAMM|nr:sulfite exporter TauE/SafE family protein [Natronospirillum operosum]TGG93856.1 sulfite exporter TauE/SafE family protein [Natronospirillum operosum]